MSGGPVRIKFVESLKRQIEFIEHIQRVRNEPRKKVWDEARGINPASDVFRKVFEERTK